MKNKILSTLIALTILTTGIFTGCGANGESSVKSTADNQTAKTDDLNKATGIRIGDLQYYFPVKVAEKKGFFEEEFGKDFKIEVSNFSNGPAVMEAFTAGEIDFASLGDMPTVQAKANNDKVKVISLLWNSPKGYTLVAGNNSGITKLEDIKGKRIAITVGTNPHKLYLKYLKKLGYTQDQVELVNLQSKDALSALVSGHVDATILTEPTATEVINNGEAKAIVTSEGYDKVLTVIVGNSDYLKANPDITKRFLKVIDKANKWAEANPEEAIALVSEYTNVPKESIEVYYNTRKFEVSLNQELRDALADTIEFTLEQGTITEKIDVNDLIDDSFVKALGK